MTVHVFIYILKTRIYKHDITDEITAPLFL
jgi:hypothetical protein